MERMPLQEKESQKKIYKQFLQAGAHVITMGNHTWDKRNFEFIDQAPAMIRPANYILEKALLIRILMGKKLP